MFVSFCGRLSPLPLPAAQQPEEGIQNHQRMGRTARDIQVNRHHHVSPVVDLRVINEGITSNGAGTHGNDKFQR
jgi:hypothetical protein